MFDSKKATKSVLWALGVTMALLPGAANAALISDGNSSVNVDASTGVQNWIVDGKNVLSQANWYYRIGLNAEAPLFNLLPNSVTVSGNTAMINSSSAAFDVEAIYTLLGGTAGSMTADLGESITLFNNGNTPLNITLINYMDFNLSAGGSTDSGSQANSSTLTQTGGGWTSTVGTTKVPTHWQISDASGLLGALNNATASILTDSAASGTGNLAHAMQWDITIGAGGSYSLSKDNLITAVPEPGSIAALSTGALSLLALGKRKKGSR